MACAMPQAMERLLASPTINARLPFKKPIDALRASLILCWRHRNEARLRAKAAPGSTMSTGERTLGVHDVEQLRNPHLAADAARRRVVCPRGSPRRAVAGA